ncbi:MAG: cysteine-rich CWC family protein [Caryophanon sp.]|nr:cysteine-rich CWC family protein [Caryophanon sp.]
MVSVCPLCTLPNECLAGTDRVASCWCMHKQFDEWVLAQIPESLKNKACICEGCYAKYHELVKKLPEK